MQIFLRSQYATTFADGVYTWLFPNPVRLGDPGDHVDVAVTLFQYISVRRNIPFEDGWVGVTIRLGESPPTGVQYYVQVSIPPGNYTAQSMAALITEGLKPLADPVEFKFDETRMGFVVVGGPMMQLTMSPSMLRILGFDLSPPDGVTWNPWDPPPTFSSYPIRSNALINFAGPTYITVETSLQSSNVADATLSSSVLAKIPITSGYADLQTYQDTISFSTIADHEITQLSIQFRDSFGDVVSFGNLPWNMTLLFKVTPTGTYKALEEEYSDAQKETTADGNRNPISDDSKEGS